MFYFKNSTAFSKKQEHSIRSALKKHRFLFTHRCAALGAEFAFSLCTANGANLLIDHNRCRTVFLGSDLGSFQFSGLYAVFISLCLQIGGQGFRFGGFGGQMPGGKGQRPEGGERPEGFGGNFPEGEMPEAKPRDMGKVKFID